MLNFTTNVPQIDKENDDLFKASQILESLGNDPGLSATEFYRKLLTSDLPVEEHDSLTLAAVAIETMMTFDLDVEESEEPTVH